MTTPTKSVKAGPDIKAFRKDLLELLNKHSGKISADHMLALSAFTVGQLIAMQDQRAMTSKMAMDLVTENIAHGNEQAVQYVIGDVKGSA